MKTAREVASELIGLWFGINDRVIREQLVDRLTAAIEDRDRETVEACGKLCDDAMYPYPQVPGEVGRGWAGALSYIARAIRSLAPPPGGTK